MYKFIIIPLFFVSQLVNAQQPISFQLADSITNQCYLNGDWDKLINFGEEALRQDIDFKKLHKRIGYAYFAKGKYFSAQKQFEKALSFDNSDLDTRAYLYYCGLNLGNKTLTGFHASKLPSETQKKMSIKSFKLIDALDAEYNYKSNDDSLGIRSNPNYYRMGVDTKLSNRINLYQSISQYNQYVNVTTATKQTEYFGSLNCIISSKLNMDVAFHYLNTKVDTTLFPGYMYYGKISSKFNRFDFGVSGSLMTNALGNFGQINAHFGLSLLETNLYIKTILTRMIENKVNTTYDSNNNRFVFSQAAGAHILKPLWLEANVTLGNIKNYNDNNGLYIYNSLDPTTFRTGLTSIIKINSKLSLVGNYTYDLKKIEQTTINYNQHSFSTGIIWKL
jgi:tetratricopeptide (TPR) repeat protein